jgi:hypothetical protein
MKIFSCCFVPPPPSPSSPPSSPAESFSTQATPDSRGQHTPPPTRVRFTHDDGASPASRRHSSATSSARGGSPLRFHHSNSSASAHSGHADDVVPAVSPSRRQSSASSLGIHSAAAQAAQRIQALDTRLNKVTSAEPISSPVFWNDEAPAAQSGYAVKDEDQGSSSSSGSYDVLAPRS